MRFIDFLKRYKWPITIGVPLVFVVIMLLLIFTSGTIQTQNPSSNNSPGSIITPPPGISSSTEDTNPGEGNEEALDNRIGLQKSESLPDGQEKFYYSSVITGRPNVILTKGQDNIVFQSTVTDPAFPVKIADYTSIHGPAKWVFKGSKFYGLTIQTHIYPEIGLAFLANPDTNDVLEQHIFEPISVEDYIKNFGEDIPAQP